MKSFDWKIVEELEFNSILPFYYFPNGSKIGGKDGLAVKFFPAVIDAWLGIFAFGNFGARSRTGVWLLPDKKRVLVVSRGQAYIVDPENPYAWSDVNCLPVKEVIDLKDVPALSILDDTGMIVYYQVGEPWVTPRIAWDSFFVDRFEKGLIYVRYEELGGGDMIECVIDVINRNVIGGANEK